MDMPLAHFISIRLAELNSVMLSPYGTLFSGKDVLEIGSGNGIQLREISKIAKSSTGLELADGDYARHGEFNIVEYDGEHIPFPDSSFDLVFSSNVMEHIAHQQQINDEIRRVLRPGGHAIHIMPTRSWRIITSILHYPRLIKTALAKTPSTPQATHGNTVKRNLLAKVRNNLVPARHGELGGWFAEYRYFGVSQWASHYQRMGWKVIGYFPIGLAYSGNCIFASRISIVSRSKLSSVFGSSTAVYVLER
jgi:SAM-dependent methyltransferase